MFYRFQYAPCTCRTFAEPDAYEQQLVLKPHSLSKEKRRRIVGCWKVGKVMDSNAVDKKDQHTLTVNVCIEWIGWMALRLLYPDAEIGDEHLARMDAPSGSSCILFAWPTVVDIGVSHIRDLLLLLSAPAA